uniref:TIGR04076 family protein n=1 Tax=Panagrolaimus superbus TaxID=310955 RepID=A0A914YLA6_9BILA
MAVVKYDEDQNGFYVCPAGFDLGNVCGGHFCYRVVSVPDAKKSRMIDDNFCAEFEKDAMPAVIKCKEENDLIGKYKF